MSKTERSHVEFSRYSLSTREKGTAFLIKEYDTAPKDVNPLFRNNPVMSRDQAISFAVANNIPFVEINLGVKEHAISMRKSS